MKRLMAVLLVLVLISVSAAGCTTKDEPTAEQTTAEQTTAEQTEPEVENFNATGLPIVNEKITLHAMQQKDPKLGNLDELFTTKWLEEKTNIHIEYEAIDKQSWPQKKQLAFASSDLPDIFLCADLKENDEMMYGMEGKMLAPLNDLIEKYAPNIKKSFEDYPDYKPSTTLPDGNMYTLAQLKETPLNLGTNRAFINKAWLDKLGMDMPETVEEMHAVLRAFKEDDPDGNGQDDTIPVSGQAGSWNNNTIDIWYYAFGWSGWDWDRNFICTSPDNPEKVIYAPYEPEYEFLLRELASLYQEGLIDKDYFLQTGPELKAKSSEGKVGLCMWGAPFGQGGMPEKEMYQQYVGIKPLVCEYNSKPIWGGVNHINAGNFAMSSTNKYPEATIRWVDYMYTEEAGTKIFYGPEIGEFEEDFGYEILSNGKYKVKVPEGQTNYLYTLATWSNRALPYRVPDSSWNEQFAETDTWLADVMHSAYAEYKQPVFPRLYFKQDVQEKVVSLKADIQNYIQQMEAKFITGGESFENFDEFREALKKMGVEEYIQLYQDAYDNYLSNVN